MVGYDVKHRSMIAAELAVREEQVKATITLLDDGATVPFIARYRKEATGGLNDIQLRQLATRLLYLRELDERRASIIASIKEQDKLTDSLLEALEAADTKTRLEDLYLPYRPKKRTKAQAAREAGLEALAMGLISDPSRDPMVFAESFIDAEKGIVDAALALEGARHILMELWSEDAGLLHELREYLWKNGVFSAKVTKETHPQAKKYKDYFSYQEPIHKVPSHRALAVFRGRKEGCLQIGLDLPEAQANYGEQTLAKHVNVQDNRQPADVWLLETVRQTWKIKLMTKLELELFARLRESSDEAAISVFAKNLKELLLAAPAGNKVTIGLDPGIRTGVKVIVIDETGKFLDYTTIYPLQPNNDWHGSIAELAKLAARYNASLISIGNGTGSRETERLVSELIKMYPDLPLTKIVVNEAGASIYSASELASAEFPDLDVSLRGAVSIARRLQDPLAELVKIEPKSIGVGQYQHDVNQSRLARTLEGVVEDCVNWVGVDINTASVSLLTHVSGLNETLARHIVQYRDTHGAFQNRQMLHEVPRMGEKSFQQAAGFLRVVNGDNPLDKSGVHPEAYPLVEKILATLNCSVTDVMANADMLRSINAADFVDESFGLPTVQDVLKELEKPGRDPRPEFKTVAFKEGVESIEHLAVGMILEGVISNVTNFGAFVDVGVHQDGLVHISMMTNRFISDPHQLVKPGDIVTVKVIEVDVERRRIGLSMKLEEPAQKVKQSAPVKEDASVNKKRDEPRNNKQPKKISPAKRPVIAGSDNHKKPEKESKKGVFNTAMMDALMRLKQGNS